MNATLTRKKRATVQRPPFILRPSGAAATKPAMAPGRRAAAAVGQAALTPGCTAGLPCSLWRWGRVAAAGSVAGTQRVQTAVGRALKRRTWMSCTLLMHAEDTRNRRQHADRGLVP